MKLPAQDQSGIVCFRGADHMENSQLLQQDVEWQNVCLNIPLPWHGDIILPDEEQLDRLPFLALKRST